MNNLPDLWMNMPAGTIDETCVMKLLIFEKGKKIKVICCVKEFLNMELRSDYYGTKVTGLR